MKVLKFGAIWCLRCIIMKSRWEKIEKELTWLETAYYNYDQDKEMAEKYKVGKDIPVFIFLDKNGEEFERMKGEVDRRELVKFLEENRGK